MAIQKENVSIDVQDIIELLHSGYTWYKKDDLGYGSIQEKYNALDMHINVIQKHPDLKNVDTIARVFVITNRNKQDNAGTTTNGTTELPNEQSLESLPKSDTGYTSRESNDTKISGISDGLTKDRTVQVTADEELSAFANL